MKVSGEMLLILKAIIIGIVEGITEFLPISSTGHMILVGQFIGFNDVSYNKAYVDMFMVVIQLGAILAIVVLFWDKILDSLKPKNLFNTRGSGFKLWLNILIAFIPAAIIGLLFNDKIDEKLMYAKPVAFALIFGAILMLILENKYRRGNKTNRLEDVSFKQALIIGVFQCLSLWPGMSRSASTIMGGWIGGLTTFAAAEFSFFLAIPTMVAASGYKLLKLQISMSANQSIALVVGFVVSFLVALVVVEKFMNFLKKKPMRVFAIYRICVGSILLILAFSKVITL